MSIGEYTGRGNSAGPAGDIYPFSASLPSSPAVLITGTTAAAQTTVHTCATGAYDMPLAYINNVSAASITVFGNIGSTTVTTGHRQFTVAAGSFTPAYSNDVMMSNSGVFGFWSTATAGIFITGYVSRFFTSSGAL